MENSMNSTSEIISEGEVEIVGDGTKRLDLGVQIAPPEYPADAVELPCNLTGAAG